MTPIPTAPHPAALRRFVVLTLVAAVAAVAIPAGPAPAAETGLESWETTPLYNDWQLSRVLGGVVYSRDGARVGTVDDATIGAGGLLETVVVRVEGTKADPRYFDVSWGEADFNPEPGTVTLAKTAATIAAMTKLETDVIAETGDWSARDLLDLHVRLAGADTSGTVADLLFTPAGTLTAYVVDLTERGNLYALPWDAGGLSPGDRVVTFPYPRTVVIERTVFVPADMTPAVAE